METFLANQVGKTRRATLHGRDWIVAPLSMIVPGILNGSKGPLLYPEEECERSAESWNHIPLTAYHPELNGQHVSARDPDVIDRQGIGVVLHAKYANGKLRGEGWFDVEKTAKVEPRILNALERGQPIELSTGLFTDNYPAPPNANHHGRGYDYVARNYRPDHLAVLPDQVGACSLNDGCGVLINAGPNQLRHGDTGRYLHMGAGTGKGAVHAAAVEGASHKTGHEQAPEDDPCDDQDTHPSIGQGDRDADELPVGSETRKYAPEIARNAEPGREPREDRRAMDAHHDISKQAAQASIRAEHLKGRGHALDALDHSKGGDSESAVGSHVLAAKQHEKAATDCRIDGREGEAERHDEAAGLHRKAASMHAATLNKAAAVAAPCATASEAKNLGASDSRSGAAVDIRFDKEKKEPGRGKTGAAPAGGSSSSSPTPSSSSSPPAPKTPDPPSRSPTPPSPTTPSPAPSPSPPSPSPSPKGPSEPAPGAVSKPDTPSPEAVHRGPAPSSVGGPATNRVRKRLFVLESVHNCGGKGGTRGPCKGGAASRAAVRMSGAGDHEAAAKAHGEAANAHDAHAREARQGGNRALAAAHEKLASAHNEMAWAHLKEHQKGNAPTGKPPTGKPPAKGKSASVGKAFDKPGAARAKDDSHGSNLAVAKTTAAMKRQSPQSHAEASSANFAAARTHRAAASRATGQRQRDYHNAQAKRHAALGGMHRDAAKGLLAHNAQTVIANMENVKRRLVSNRGAYLSRLNGREKNVVAKEQILANTWSDAAREAAAAARRANSQSSKSIKGGYAEAAGMGSGAARGAVRAAKSASARAEKASASGDHDRAARAHAEAAGHHRVAATAMERAGQRDAARAHKEAADKHDVAGHEHRGSVPRTKTSTGGPAGNSRRGPKINERREPMTKEEILANCRCEEDREVLNALSEETWQGILTANAKAEGSNADVTGSGKFMQAGGEGKKEEYSLSKNEGDDDDDFDGGDRDDDSGDAGGDQGYQDADDDDEDDGEKGSPMARNGRQMTANEWLRSAPPEIREAVSEGLQARRERKLKVVRRLVGNIANPERRKARGDALMRKPLNELNDMLELVGSPAPRARYAPPLFTGMAGGAVANSVTGNARDDDESALTLGLPTINWKELSKEHQRS